MNELQETAYCGIYCPDCIRYNNKYQIYARQLRDELEDIEFHKYAEVDSPFEPNFKSYNEFIEVLTVLSALQCNKPCRVGGGCSGTPCKIMDCCLSKNFEGCWQCTDLDECEKFDILEPRCGEMPKNNIKIIQKNGIQNWIEFRDKFYIWQKK